MRFLLNIVLCGLLFVASSYATIYKWEDKQGNVHFSDRPEEGANEVDLSPPQTYQSNLNSTTATFENLQPTKDSITTYKYVNIVEPQKEATIRNNEGSVDVIVNMEPKLLPNHKLMILLDGQAVGVPQTNMAIKLSNIYRGTHRVGVKVIDEKGQSMIQSDEVIFYLHRPIQNTVKPLLPQKPGN